MRGRSIIAGNKDLVVNVNGNVSQVDRTAEIVIPTTHTDQSTHRISNEKLPNADENDKKDETVLDSMPYTPADQPLDSI